MRTPTPLALGSLLLLGSLVAALAVRSSPRGIGPDPAPLVVYVAASLRPVMQAVAADYETHTGHRVELRFGASEDLLTRIEFPAPNDPADLFLPADDSYVRLAIAKGLVAADRQLTVMRAVLLLPPVARQRKPVRVWADLMEPGTRVSLANDGTAIGKLVRVRLVALGLWRDLGPNVVGAGTVTESANATPVGAVDAAIVWDAVARNFPAQPTVTLPELADLRAEVRIARLKQARDPAAADAFFAFVAGPGQRHFHAFGFPPPLPR